MSFQLLEPGGLRLKSEWIEPVVPGESVDDLAQRTKRVADDAVASGNRPGTDRAQRGGGRGRYAAGQPDSSLEQTAQIGGPKPLPDQQIVAQPVDHDHDVTPGLRYAEHVTAVLGIAR